MARGSMSPEAQLHYPRPCPLCNGTLYDCADKERHMNVDLGRVERLRQFDIEWKAALGEDVVL
jgi:hypothetical protein